MDYIRFALFGRLTEDLPGNDRGPVFSVSAGEVGGVREDCLTSTDKEHMVYVAHPPSLCLACSLLTGFSFFSARYHALLRQTAADPSGTEDIFYPLEVPHIDEQTFHCLFGI